MNLEWIDDFIALVDTRNFTRAADRRATTQSAYSRRIQRMEEWFGVPLFDRTKRPLELTPAGSSIDLSIRTMRSDMMDMRRIAGSAASALPDAMKIYTTNSLAIGFLPDYLLDEGIDRFSLVVAGTSACIAAVKEGRADMAVIPSFHRDELEKHGLMIEDVGQDRLAFCAREDLVDHIALIEPHLFGPILTYTPGTAYGNEIRKNLESQNIKLAGEPSCESASAEALLAQVRMGHGAAWIPQSMIVRNDKLCPLFDHQFDCPYTIIALHPNRTVKP